MRQRWPTLSIRSTVLLAIVGAVLLPAWALLQLDEVLMRSTQEPLVARNRQAVLATVAAALAEPISAGDPRRLRSTAQRALDEPAVLALRVGERRALEPPLELRRAGSSGGVALHAPIVRDGQTLSELTLWFDAGQIDRLLSERRTAILQLAGLQILLGLALLLTVLRRRLLAPIQRLKRQASDIAGRALVAPVAWSDRDELGQLGRHLNQVHGQIDRLFKQLEAQAAEMQTIALHDPLTGLPNRRLFAELTQTAVAAAQRDGARLALLFIDVDRFKSINDTLGHAAGDLVLQTLSGRLRAAVRSADVLCRHSGDEFTVLLRDVSGPEEVAASADRLLAQTEAPVRIGGRDVAVSASIGIAMYPDDAADHETLVRHADTAMYAAKQMGRARCSFFRAQFNTQLQATLQFEQEMARAIEADQFVLHFQPLVRSGDGTICGCEALIRWQHPQRGLVGPGEFIPAAEQCGLISVLGGFVIRAACAQIARWKADGLPFGTVAVNVSALEFRHHRLIDTLTRAMADFGVQPDELEIEVTESLLMTDTDNTQRIVDRLHLLGLRLAVDDFGTGYSSLAYLKRLRPAKIKIDRSFVKDLPDDANDRVLVQAITQLARSLGIEVVAEGVETLAQRDFLTRCGCDMLQGYLLSRPQPAEGFAEFVRRSLRPVIGSFDNGI